MAAICVFCASSQAVHSRYVDLATAVGTELARRGHSLVSGGGSVSLMGAVATAARTNGAHTVGVIPEALKLLEVADLGADELVVTADMRSRKAEMDRRADAFLILPGGLGTLEELLEIWVARHLAMHSKPIVVLDPDGVYRLLREQVQELAANGFVRPAAYEEVVWVTDVADAFNRIDVGLA
jgi:uncharacterized protein (TIGR00730 family)